ncbi:Putative mitochondrial carrier domain superfamily [Septoria linicola]|uniref:Mitochondrial carrier domain superfamily n=1 Tax=Septoria linicola TaxID=215465 RepID=A0A9Q9EDR5_9PEZI|nr:putative mitochondrial carrier domain superfamily [Septoria linicola]USW47085.1 Putative mitochondrial carrier domain superfamily [Septoria linicola]
MSAKEVTALDNPAAPTPAAAAAAAVPAPDVQPSLQASNKGIEALKDIVYGSVAGIVGKVVEYPFDTVKVRLQSQPDHLPLRYAGPLDCFKQSLAEGGVRGLYRGVSAPLVGAAAENASLFWAYRLAQDVLKVTVLPGTLEGEKLPLGALVAAGAMSGCVTSLVLTPIELVKCRMQVPSQSPQDPSLRVSRGPLAIISDVWKREGLAGFWRGQLGTLLRETGGGAAWFGSYETLSLYFKNRLRDPENDSLPIWQQMVSGAVAGMAYNFVFFPADTIKSKIQTGELTNVKPTFTNVGKELFQTHGLKGLYRGCGITVARSAPSSALIFTIYEYLRKTFG